MNDIVFLLHPDLKTKKNKKLNLPSTDRFNFKAKRANRLVFVKPDELKVVFVLDILTNMQQ